MMGSYQSCDHEGLKHITIHASIQCQTVLQNKCLQVPQALPNIAAQPWKNNPRLQTSQFKSIAHERLNLLQLKLRMALVNLYSFDQHTHTFTRDSVLTETAKCQRTSARHIAQNLHEVYTVQEALPNISVHRPGNDIMRQYMPAARLTQV